MGKRMIVAAMAILLLLNLTPFADRAADAYFDKALKTAAVTFAVARVLNGIISVLQQVEVAATPAGVGVSVSPGQILDPLNDLVEKFSTVMLMATVSLAIQNLLLTFSTWLPVKAVIAVLLLVLLAWFIRVEPAAASRMKTSWPFKIVFLVLFLRFAIPFVGVSSGIFETLFLNDPIQAKTGQLQLVEQTANEIIEADEEASWHESLIAGGKNLVKVKENARIIKEKITGVIGTIIDLIALFIIQAVLMPLGFLYLAVKFFEHLFAARTV